MGLCDRLEAARAGREAVRDRLAAASLARLNAPDPETFQADARFALDALPALTTRPDQIKRLRQTILNLAVRGKLVPQDANDEPASELLKRIAKERDRVAKAVNKGTHAMSKAAEHRARRFASCQSVGHGQPIARSFVRSSSTARTRRRTYGSYGVALIHRMFAMDVEPTIRSMSITRRQKSGAP